MMEVCPKCGKYVDPSDIDEITGWCAKCTPRNTRNVYFQANADKIEHYLSQGYSVDSTISFLADPKNGHRPTCIVCGSVIKHAPKTSVFCRKKKECRRYSRRYVYLYTKRGMTKTQALATVISEVT